VPDHPPEWHTAQVRAWLAEHPEVKRWVLEHPTDAHYVPALQLAARDAIVHLPGVDFGMVDWDAALTEEPPSR
jgi:hypothetical protein